MANMLGVALSDVRGLLGDLFDKLSGEDWMIWLAELKKFLRKETCWVTTIWVTTMTNPYLKGVATGKLGETTGQRTLARAKKTFPGGLDSNFANWKTDVKGEPTEEAPFEVLELVKGGTFNQVFGAFGVNLDRLCWSQDQIISFIENHADKLHPQGYATFFLFKVDNEFFVARARRLAGSQLEACLYRLSYDYVWSAGYRSRFVVSQL